MTYGFGNFDNCELDNEIIFDISSTSVLICNMRVETYTKISFSSCSFVSILYQQILIWSSLNRSFSSNENSLVMWLASSSRQQHSERAYQRFYFSQKVCQHKLCLWPFFSCEDDAAILYLILQNKFTYVSILTYLGLFDICQNT